MDNEWTDLDPSTVEACAQGCESLAKYKAPAAAAALRQAARDMRERLNQLLREHDANVTAAQRRE